MADEHPTALEVRRLLVRLNEDRTLRAELLAATGPSDGLAERVRAAGFDLDDASIGAVVRALRRRHEELDATSLDTVSGGAGSFLPEVDDDVVVAFEHGDPDRPIIVGSLWNPADKPPTARKT